MEKLDDFIYWPMHSAGDFRQLIFIHVFNDENSLWGAHRIECQKIGKRRSDEKHLVCHIFVFVFFFFGNLKHFHTACYINILLYTTEYVAYARM